MDLKFGKDCYTYLYTKAHSTGLINKFISNYIMSNHFYSKTVSCDYQCAYCGEINSTFVDPSQGNMQEYIEDCQVCCRPNFLKVSYDEWQDQFDIRSEIDE